MNTGSRTCWICGDIAMTGEHLIKASDLKSQFGKISQVHPIYIHIGKARNRRVPGKNAQLLKYVDMLCAKCNNDRTQPHDLAWEKLSSYLQSNDSPISAGMSMLDLAKVFGSNVATSLVSLQLFFIKQFGCMIVQNGVPMDVSEFATCILENKPHPRVFLEFGTGLEDKRVKLVSRSALNTIAFDGKICFAHWIYMLDKVAVRVYFADEHHQKYQILKHAVHPSQPRRRLRIVRF
jgi:hypothetical protein